MSPTVEVGIATWRVPLSSCAIQYVFLDDCGYHVRRIFDNPDKANGLNLEVAIENVHYEDLARDFETATVYPARFIDENMDYYWARVPLSMEAALDGGHNSDPSHPTFMTVRENFTGFLNLWRDYHIGVVSIGYTLLRRTGNICVYFCLWHTRLRIGG